MARQTYIKSQPMGLDRHTGLRHSLESHDQTEMIRRVAQNLYEKRGRQPGHDLDNWLEAERMVTMGKI